MDIEFARFIVIGLASVALVVWLFGYSFVRRVAFGSTPDRASWDAGTSDVAPPANCIVGTAELNDDPDKLADRAVAALIQNNNELLGPIKIVEKSSERLRFEPADTTNPQTWFRQGQMQWTALESDRTRVDYVVELAPKQKLIWGAWTLLALGFIVLAIAAPLLYLLVASSPIPAVRYQSIQMVQIVHFLWPPFMMANMYRRGRETIRARMEALVNNLPYLQATK